MSRKIGSSVSERIRTLVYTRSSRILFPGSPRSSPGYEALRQPMHTHSLEDVETDRLQLQPLTQNPKPLVSEP